MVDSMDQQTPPASANEKTGHAGQLDPPLPCRLGKLEPRLDLSEEGVNLGIAVAMARRPREQLEN